MLNTFILNNDFLKQFIFRIILILGLGMWIYVGFTEYTELTNQTTYLWGHDLSHYIKAITQLKADISPYYPFGWGGIFYHPILLPLFTLLSYIRFDFLIFFWTGLNVIIFIFTLAKLNRIFSLNKKYSAATFLVFLTFVPTIDTLYLGQLNILTLFLVTILFSIIDKNRPYLQGIILFLLFALKISPLLLAAYYLFTKRTKPLVVFGGLFVMTTAFSTLLYTPSILKDYASVFFNTSLIDVVTGGNISVFTSISYLAIPLTNNFTIFSTIRTVTSLVFAGFLIESYGFKSVKNYSGLFFILLCISVIFSPLIWHHHIILLIPVFYFLLTKKGKFYIIIGGISLVFFQVSVLFYSHGILLRSLGQIVLILYIIREMFLVFRGKIETNT